MKTSLLTHLAFAKMRRQKNKSLLVVIPLSVLLAIALVIAHQGANVISATEQSVVGTASEQAKYIQVSANQANAVGGGRAIFIGASQGYQQNDVDKILGIKHVTEASLTPNLPIDTMRTSDLIANKTINLRTVQSLPTSLAGAYTDQEFSYTSAEQVVPVILNVRNLIHQYEDWEGKTEFEITISRPTTRGSAGGGAQAFQMPSTPIKFEQLDLKKDDILGKEFTLEIGGLSQIQTYDQELTDSGMKFLKLSQEELDKRTNERNDAIDDYWDVSKLNTPLRFKAKIVGVVDDASSFASYVPADFAAELMKRYIQNQIDARTDKAIPKSALGTTFTGLTYDGVELGTGTVGIAGAGFSVRLGGRAAGGVSLAGQDGADSYAIPGFLISTTRATNDASAVRNGTTGEAKEELFDPNVWTQAAVSGDTILVKIDSLENRSAVVADINTAGYAFQDTDAYEAFGTLYSNVQRIVQGSVIAFGVLSALLLLFLITRIISDGKKEIGVLRALGFSANAIRSLMALFTLGLVTVAYVVGVAVSTVVTLAVASPLQSWFVGFIKDTLGTGATVVQKVDAATWYHFDLGAVWMYTAIMVAVALIAAVVAATLASRIQPAQAVRQE